MRESNDSRPARRRALPFTVVLAVGLAACAKIEAVLERTVAGTPHEAYQMSLDAAGLSGTALARRWREVATTSLAQPIPIDPPYEEIGFFPAESPSAAAYLVSLRRGESLLALIESVSLPPSSPVAPSDSVPGSAAGSTPGSAPAPDSLATAASPPAPNSASGPRVFLDLYRLEPGGGIEHVAHAPRDEGRIEFEPAEDGEFVLRVQPELLRSVRIRLLVIRAATLAFPVGGRDADGIRSGFGAPRDAGRREHHGVDIFAPRGTPVLAAADGVVRRVGANRLGGNIIWLRDAERRQSFYYAHLERQLVRDGQRVRAGDTVGLVGNSGNARTTPPHLHFGVYRRGEGPVDPYPFIARQPSRPPPLRVDTDGLGGWIRTTAGLRARIAGEPEERPLPRHTVARLLGAAGRGYRVGLPDGRVAILPGGSVESLATRVGETLSARPTPVLEAPRPGALAMTTVQPTDTLAVLGRFGGYVLIEQPGGVRGWLPADG